MANIILEIKAKHFYENGVLVDNFCLATKCPVAMAAREYFGIDDVSESITYITINRGEQNLQIYDHKHYGAGIFDIDYIAAQSAQPEDIIRIIELIQE